MPENLEKAHDIFSINYSGICRRDLFRNRSAYASHFHIGASVDPIS